MDENPDEQDEEMTRGELLDFLGDFLSQHRDANTLYRDHLCAILIGRVYDATNGPQSELGIRHYL
jgi:hypothetical protein